MAILMFSSGLSTDHLQDCC